MQKMRKKLNNGEAVEKVTSHDIELKAAGVKTKETERMWTIIKTRQNVQVISRQSPPTAGKNNMNIRHLADANNVPQIFVHEY